MSNQVSISSLKLSQVEARTILEALRRGGVPTDYAELIAVGRSHWLSSVMEDLDFVAAGGAKPRLIVAPYGGGKSHFLTLVSSVAVKQNFVVSYVELQSREAPFDRFEIIFGKVIRQVKTRYGQGVQHILDNWTATFPYYSAREIEDELNKMSRSLDFRNALRSYLELSSISSPDSLRQRQDIVAWLQGDSLPASVLKGLGIRSRITITNVSGVMTSFLEFLQAAKYSGLVLLLDEAEAITSLTQSRKREEANQNLRKLLDNTDANKGFYILFATTPRFMEDPDRGARSYPALWDRIRTVVTLPRGMVSKRTIIMNLEALSETDIRDLTKKVISIHEIAWNWSSEGTISENTVNTLVRHYKKIKPDGPVRPFLRTLIDLLDLLQESNGLIELNDMINELTFGDL